MTYEELANEILTDWYRNAYPFYLERLLKLHNKYRRIVMTSNPQKPMFFKGIEYISPKMNKFVVVPYSISRSDFKKRGVCFISYAKVYYKNRWLLLHILCSQHNLFINIITRHFIKRYLERFLNPRAEVIEDMYLEFLKRNSVFMYIDKGTEKCVISDDGMFLGEQINGNCFLFKTYIPRNQFHDDQKTVYDRGLEDIDQYQEYNHIINYGKIAG